MKRTIEVDVQWYGFNQNNSGGHFDVNNKLCYRLFIEAISAADANEKAEDLGCYWDGVEDGRDCSCCGDRWYPASSPIKFPMNYGKDKVFETVEQYAQYVANEYGWTEPDARIFYLDGTVKEIFRETKR